MLFAKDTLIEHKDIIDSSRLLNYCVKTLKESEKKFEIARLQLDNLDSYWWGIVRWVDGNRKMRDKDISNKLNKLNHLPNKETYNALKNEMEDYEAFYRALEETIKILKPIDDDKKALEEILFKIDMKIMWFHIKKKLSTLIWIIGLSFLLSAIFDCLQNLTEYHFELNHFFIIAISFLIQQLIIEPYILNRVRNRVNWKLINHLKEKIPPINNEIDELIKNFNDKVCNHKELIKFKIDIP